MRTRINHNKEQIFCDFRRRWVRLTPEEWVRQQLLHRLVERHGFPASLIAVEVPFRLPSLQGGDGGSLFPLMIIECKAETVPLSQKTLDQAVAYNRKLNVPYLLLHNGPQTVFADLGGDTVHFTGTIPDYTDITH